MAAFTPLICTNSAELSESHSDSEWYVNIFYFQLAHKSTYCTFHIWLFTIQQTHQKVVNWTSHKTVCISIQYFPFKQRNMALTHLSTHDHLQWSLMLLHFRTSQIWFSGRRLPIRVQEFPETVSQVSPRVSTEAERHRQARGTAVRPLWRICCSRCGKSGPSWQQRRKPSCPTRQRWKPHRWVAPPVPSGASRPCLHTSSPESSPCPCWAETRTNTRLKQGFKGSTSRKPEKSRKTQTHVVGWQRGSRKSKLTLFADPSL